MGERSPDVDAWFAAYENPQKGLVQQVRAAILDAAPEATETIKWQAPTFVYKGNIASFYPKTKTHASLMFHQGASLPDPTGLLEGSGDVSRVAKVLDDDDLAAKRDALQEIIRAWVAAKG